MNKLSGFLAVLPVVPVAAIFFVWLWDEHKKDKAELKRWQQEDDAL